MPWHHQNYCKQKRIMTMIEAVIIALSGVFGCLDTLVKWLAFFAESVDGSRWALQSLPPPQGLDSCVWQVGDKETFPKKRVRTCLPRRLLHSAAPALFPSFQVRVFEEIVVLTSQEMKRRAPDRTVTKKSMVPVLKHIYTHPQPDGL